MTNEEKSKLLKYRKNNYFTLIDLDRNNELVVYKNMPILYLKKIEKTLFKVLLEGSEFRKIKLDTIQKQEGLNTDDDFIRNSFSGWNICPVYINAENVLAKMESICLEKYRGDEKDIYNGKIGIGFMLEETVIDGLDNNRLDPENYFVIISREFGAAI